jgi:HAD superfamily hydrolase (TIGR01459 family)
MNASAVAIAINNLRSITDSFDHVLLDQWGTLHEGKSIYPAAYNCVLRLRESGKRVLVLSNSGRRAEPNLKRLATLGLPPQAYDGVLSSGEVTWHGLRARAREPFASLGRSCFLITRDHDRSIVDKLDIRVVADIGEADFILLGGLDEDVAEPAHWRARLSTAAARRLPMLCANPDLVMFGTSGLTPAPGALAAFYQSLGGAVQFVGKPHQAMFEAALEQLGNPAPERVLVIGDSLDHDIAGGRATGMLTLLISSGAHREALAKAADPQHALRLMAGLQARMPHWMMKHLAW